ncbi:MAG: triose-phosphate isomerase [Candidatus Omnitrophica bacterium]|nr:triose-phosphate isomerase [Candidatus Omnitrophota bacterium]
MRKIIIAGNWKLNKTLFEAIDLVNGLKRELVDVSAVDIVVCPVFTALSDVKDTLTDTNIEVGAQNLYWEDSGAFTGEVSAPLLKDLGVKYVIIGHSERRQFFGETNETVNKRIKAALKHKLIPIVCVGENLQEREANKTFDVVRDHIEGSLAGFTKDEIKEMVIAYEPVWAIGTGKTATAQQAQEVHKYIRGLLEKIAGVEVAQAVRIQYGGSVKAENTAELIGQEDIDGALVGGASLKADSFAAIVKNSVTVATK